MLIDPKKLALVLVSPMQRACKTYDLMFMDQTGLKDKVIFTEDLIEWNYGDYEGLKTDEIRSLREKKRLNGKHWDLCKDGCQGGEYVFVRLGS